MRDKSDPMLPYRYYGLDQFRHEYEALARVDSDGCWHTRDEVDAELESLRAALAAAEQRAEGFRKDAERGKQLWDYLVDDRYPWSDAQDSMVEMGFLVPVDMTAEDSGPECDNCDGDCGTCYRPNPDLFAAIAKEQP